jgi:transcriptional regulator with XRE-family HTH domain
MKAKGLLARKMEDPAYRKRFEESYELFKLEVKLLNALERKHWSYSDLARAVGTNKSQISRDLNGGLGTASIGRVSKMADALGLRFIPLCLPKEKMKRALPILKKLEILRPRALPEERMKRKDRNGLPLSEFLAEELSDSEVRRHYEAARAEGTVARAVSRARKASLTSRRAV